MYTELVLHKAIYLQNGYARVRVIRNCVTVEGCGFRSVRYLEVKINTKRSERSSVIENWEVVRSSEARNI